jgi:aminopeptidase N
MKHLMSFFFISVSLFCNAQSNIDVLHYKFNIELNDSNDTIYGLAVIYFKVISPSEEIELDFKSLTNEKKGMKILDLNSPKLLGIRITASPAHLFTFSHEKDKIKIKLPKKLSVGEMDTVAIEYRGVPSDGLIISKNKYGKRTFFADNWPNRGHNWLPCNDDPADKASVEFIVTAPQHYQVVSNGIQIEETNLPDNEKRTHWKEDVPVSTKVMVIGVSDFAVNLSGVIDGCIPVYSWVYPEDRDKGFYDYALAAEILPWFIKNVGPYGYKKLANVQSKTTFGGLENANTIFYSESSVTGNRSKEGLIVHEIAHQWFGNMATEKTFAHLWLSEGFATYMTILYMENKYGKDTAIAMLKEDREQVINFARTSNRPVVDHTKDYMELLNANSYQKGGWVLHMLRQELGDSLFWKGIRKYYSTYAGKTADTDDLRKVLEEVSGKKLEQFFKQWLYTAGIPRLKISWKFDVTKKNILVTVEQLQAEKFQFPLSLSIASSTERMVKKVMISKSAETFSFPVKHKPNKIEADPGASILFDGAVFEMK